MLASDGRGAGTAADPSAEANPANSPRIDSVVASLAENLATAVTVRGVRVRPVFNDGALGEIIPVPVNHKVRTVRDVLNKVTSHYDLEYWFARKFKVYTGMSADDEPGPRADLSAETPIKDHYVPIPADLLEDDDRALLVHIPKPLLRAIRVRAVFDDGVLDKTLRVFVDSESKIADVITKVVEKYQTELDAGVGSLKAYVDDLSDDETGPLDDVVVFKRTKSGPSQDKHVPDDLLDSRTKALIVFIPLPFEDGAPVTRTKAKSIVVDGIPPMQEHGDIASSDRAAIPNLKPCRIADEALPDLKIDAAAKEHLLRELSATWTLFEKSRSAKFTYSSEASITPRVLSVLTDVESVIRRFLGPEYSLRFDNDTQTGKNRPDIWVLLRDGKPVGVLEVKKRTRNSDVAMTHPKIIGECFDNMLALRAFDGIDNVYCILTDYHEWCVLCLSDTVEDAKSTVMPCDPIVSGQLNENISLTWDIPVWPSTTATPSHGHAASGGASSSASASVPLAVIDDDSSTKDAPHQPNDISALGDNSEIERLVYATRIYSWNDPHLIEMLAAALIKMAKSPATMLDDPLRAGRPCRLIKEDSVTWMRWPAERSVTFDEFPSGQFKKFMLLLFLGAGCNGQTFLASTVPPDKDKTAPGKACVIKLPLASFNLSTDQQIQLFEQEAALWRTIWDARGVRVQTLNNQPAIIMPYVKTCKGTVTDQTDDVKKAAIAAIDHMAKCGYKHNEARWEHVGLRKKDAAKGTQFSAVLIDLGNVTQFDKNVKEEVQCAKNDMLAALRL